MLEVVLRSVQFLSDASRTHLFGLGCPLHCQQPSYSLLILCFFRSFLSGYLSFAYLFWTFWTFANNPPSTSSSEQAPVATRYSSLAGYLHATAPPTATRFLSFLVPCVASPSLSEVLRLRLWILFASSLTTTILPPVPSDHSFDLVSELPPSPRLAASFSSGVGPSAFSESRTQIESSFARVPARGIYLRH